MKRKSGIVCLILIAAIFCLVIAGCGEKEPEVYATEPPMTEGISLELVSAYLDTDVPYAKIKWTNESDKTISFSNNGQFYKDNNGTWESIGAPSNEFGLNTLEAGQTMELDYLLSDVELTVPGKYKFDVVYTVHGDDVSVDYLTYEFELN